jgi:hypothetical protein
MSPETPMVDVEVEYGTKPELTAEMVRAQLELLVRDESFRSSRRSVAFLRYVVEQTLAGQADQIKERSIGVEVFGRDPSYDTSGDHIVRTAALELRKRLATYYVDPRHQSELRMALVPGSYIPRFTLPQPSPKELPRIETVGEPAAEESVSAEHRALIQLGPVSLQPRAATAQQAPPLRWWRRAWVPAILAAVALAAAAWGLFRRPDPQDLFWSPVLNTPGPILVAVGDHPNGPPTLPEVGTAANPPTPVPSSDASETVPFADTVTIAKVVSVLAARNRQVLIRRGNSSSFSDLREGAAVLVGAFNNEWSLRLTRQLRYSLAMDAEKHLIYIRDAKNPSSRSWSWGTDQPRELATGVNSPRIQDFALVSRIRDSETGHVVVVIGGLYTYGTQAAGEFLTDSRFMRELARSGRLNGSTGNLQIVLGTAVTDGTPGPPQVLAVSQE